MRMSTAMTLPPKRTGTFSTGTFSPRAGWKIVP